jgi:hypothetical protein
VPVQVLASCRPVSVAVVMPSSRETGSGSFPCPGVSQYAIRDLSPAAVLKPGCTVPESSGYGISRPLSRLITPSASEPDVFFGSGPSLGRTACPRGELWGISGALLKRVVLGRACPRRRSAQVELHAFTMGLEINGSDEKEG